MKKVLQFASFGLTAAISLMFSIIIGQYLDTVLNTNPLFTLGLLLLILVLWILRIIKWVKELDSERN